VGEFNVTSSTSLRRREYRWVPVTKRLGAITFLLLTGTLYIFNGFEFPAPDGSRDRMSLNSKELRSDKSLGTISEIGVNLSVDKSTCDSSAKGTRLLSRQLEYELDLRGIIDSLSMRSKPRVLSDIQRKMISKIPVCEPYLDELKVISKLLSGYDLIQISETKN
jgi:hypothetical protein